MNLHDLETFVSIARLGGVTRAAGQLHRSQPAMTRRIQLLEDHLGAPLLERGRSGAMLTEAGRTFLPYAEAVLAALKDGTQAVQALRGSDHGAVSLAIVGTLAGTTIVEQLRRFSAPQRMKHLHRSALFDHLVGPQEERFRIVRPSAFAVVRFTTRSNRVGCSTGMSPGFAPRRILST
jgi:DNA-binding transcriptional LysR family regulator